MGSVNIGFYQQIVEPMLRSSWQALRHLEAELSETGRADRYQQSCDRLPAIAQVLQARINKIATRQSCVHCYLFQRKGAQRRQRTNQLLCEVDHWLRVDADEEYSGQRDDQRCSQGRREFERLVIGDAVA